MGDKPTPTGRSIERFTPLERAAHWVNAIAFVVLAVSGIVMAFGKFFLLPVLGATLFGWLSFALKNLHNFAGPLFAVSLLIVILTFVKDNLPRQGDMAWLAKGGGLLGGAHIPSAALQRRREAAVLGAACWCSAVITVGSGLVLDQLVPQIAAMRGNMQIAHMVHGAATVLMMAMFIGHIYMGTIGTRGAYSAMRHGYVDEAWAQEHHELWYDDIKAGRVPAQRSACPKRRKAVPPAPMPEGESRIMTLRIRDLLALSLLGVSSLAGVAKLPPPSDEAKAKAAEAAAKAAHGGKVAAYKLCQAMDKVAARYYRRFQEGRQGHQTARSDAGLRRPRPLCCGACTGRQVGACRPRGEALPPPTPAAPPPLRVAGAPRLTKARGELLREITILDEYGERRRIHIPAERPLTLFVDRRELVTLMTLGAMPELLVLGYLLNQRLIRARRPGRVGDRRLGGGRGGREDTRRRERHRGAHGAGGWSRPAAVKARSSATCSRTCTASSCPRSSRHASARAPCTACSRRCASRTASTARPARCTAARCSAAHELLMFVEDVGRHNAIDTIAGWMAPARHRRRRQGLLHHRPADQRDGHEVGADRRADHRLAQRRHGDGPSRWPSRLGMTLFGRAANRHFLCYTGVERFDSEPEPQRRRGARRLRLTRLASPTATGDPLDESPVSCRPGRQPLAA